MGDSPTSALGALANAMLHRASGVAKKDAPTAVVTPVVAPETTTPDDENRVQGHPRANAKTNLVNGLADKVVNKSPEAKALRKELNDLCQKMQREPGYASNETMQEDVARLRAVATGNLDLDTQHGRIQAYKQLLTTCATHRSAIGPSTGELARRIATGLEALQSKEGRKLPEGHSGRHTLHNLLFEYKQDADKSQVSLTRFNQTVSPDQIRLFFKVATTMSAVGTAVLPKGMEPILGSSGMGVQATLAGMTASLTSKGYVSDGQGGFVHPTTHLPPTDAEVVDAFGQVKTNSENQYRASWSNFADVVSKNGHLLGPDQKTGAEFWKSLNERNINTRTADDGGTRPKEPDRLSHEVYDLMAEMGLGTDLFKDGDAWLKKAMSPTGIKASELSPDQANFLTALQAKHPNLVRIEGDTYTVTANVTEQKELNSFIAGMTLVSFDDGTALSKLFRDAYADVEISTRHLRDMNALKSFFERALVDPNRLGFGDLLPKKDPDQEEAGEPETAGWTPPDVTPEFVTATTILTTSDPELETAGNVAMGFVPAHEDAEEIRSQGLQQQQTLNRLWDELDRDFKRTIRAMDA
jgi:hypothetical protein